MKLKVVLSVLLLSTLMVVDAYPFAANDAISEQREVPVYTNDVPFDILTTGEDDGYRSAIPPIPFLVFMDESNRSIELDFIKPVGEVEIVISHNGTVVYSSSENILSSFAQKFIQLSSDLAGDCFIEIKAVNGAYAYGSFGL